MSDLEIFGRDGSLVAQPVSRRTGRAVGRTHESAIVRTAAVEAEAEVTVEKVAAIGTVVRAAQLQSALAKQAAKNLGLIAPEASIEIAHLAETGTLLMSEVLIQGARRIARY